MRAAHAAVSGVTSATACTTRAAEDRPAHVALLVIIKKDDKIGGGLSDGQQALEIAITDESIQPEETDETLTTCCHCDDRRPELRRAKAR